MSLVIDVDGHIHSGVSVELLDWIAKKYEGAVRTAEKTMLFDTFQVPAEFGQLSCGLHGPCMGDEIVNGDEVHYYVRDAGKGEPRAGESRLVDRPMRMVSSCTIVAGGPNGPEWDEDEEGKEAYVLYAVFGGALAPREPFDPDIRKEEDLEESREFWTTHALTDEGEAALLEERMSRVGLFLRVGLDAIEGEIIKVNGQDKVIHTESILDGMRNVCHSHNAGHYGESVLEHTSRVLDWAEFVGRRESEEKRQFMRALAIWHDIGKVFVAKWSEKSNSSFVGYDFPEDKEKFLQFIEQHDLIQSLNGNKKDTGQISHLKRWHDHPLLDPVGLFSDLVLFARCDCYRSKHKMEHAVETLVRDVLEYKKQLARKEREKVMAKEAKAKLFQERKQDIQVLVEEALVGAGVVGAESIGKQVLDMTEPGELSPVFKTLNENKLGKTIKAIRKLY